MVGDLPSQKRRRIHDDEGNTQEHDSQSESSDIYSYANCPLTAMGDIRVLTIRKGRKGDVIECTLTTRPLDTSKWSQQLDRATRPPVHYEALSYHWGSPGEEVAIRISTPGIVFASDFYVSPNLHAALEQLRFPDGSRTLWIDAICIDQENTSERNSQVSIMAAIYQTATHVCVWLGTPSEDSGIALDFISRVVNLDEFDFLVTDSSAAKYWGALSSLMKRKWFSRRWVVQEIALAKRATLYCGTAEADWSDFAVAVSLFEAAETKGRVISKAIMNSSHYGHVPDFLGEIKSLGATRLVDATSNLFRKPKSGDKLERLLDLDVLISNLSVFEASRPHDVIYAVLALSRDTYMSAMVDGEIQTPNLNHVDVQEQIRTEPQASQVFTSQQAVLARGFTKKIQNVREEKRFTVDYDRNFFDVCKDFLKFTIRRSKSLDIICRPWAPADGFNEHNRPPSWLLTMSRTAFGQRPDGSYSRKHADTLVGTPGHSRRNYSASHTFEVNTNWKFGEDERCRSMYVEGFIVDVIIQKKPSAMEGIIPHSWLEAGGWKDSSALPPDSFWRTIVADRGPNGINPPAFYPRACKTALNKSVQGSHISTGKLIDTGKSEIVAEFLRRVHEVIWSRRLIVTQQDLLGLGPDDTKRQDLICILYGCSVPIILRPMNVTDGKAEFYHFVGESYVHGIMDGEAFEIAKSRNAEQKIDKILFELR